ncbi:MAG: glucose/galactose MFS transporter, partial [Hymenobacter sp.]
MATPVTTAAATATAAPTRSYAGPMALMTLLFLLFGAVTNFNGVLMPHLKDVCQL